MRRALRFSLCFSSVGLAISLVGCRLIEERQEPQREAAPVAANTAAKPKPKAKRKHKKKSKPAPLATVAEPQESDAPDEAEATDSPA